MEDARKRIMRCKHPTPCSICLTDCKLAEVTAKEDEVKTNLIAACKACVEPLLRYKSSLQGYARESAHKGNRSNQSFWEKRIKEVVKISDEIKQTITKAEEEK